MAAPTHPQFIVVEGLDGSGKSTLAADLALRLGGAATTTPSPELRRIRPAILDGLSGSPVARQAFYLATVAHASDGIRSSLARGQTVILDRYLLSTMVYAAARGEFLRWPELERDLLPAHLTLFVDVPLAVRRARLQRRGMGAEDRETLDPSTDRALRDLYLRWARHPVAGRFVRLEVGPHDAPAAVTARALGLLHRSAA